MYILCIELLFLYLLLLFVSIILELFYIVIFCLIFSIDNFIDKRYFLSGNVEMFRIGIYLFFLKLGVIFFFILSSLI